MEKNVVLRPYDNGAAESVFNILFNHIDYETEDGLMELPSASYQLVVSALEYILWDLQGDSRDTIRKAISIVEGLRDKQSMREWQRNGGVNRQ